MSHFTRARTPARTPIERIFQKVMHRKMTSQERIYFHLKRQIKPPPPAKAAKPAKPRKRAA
jgi:hypothetical protein